MTNTKGSLSPLVAGAAAGMTESFVTYPTEYVKTVSQLSSRGLRVGPVDVVKTTLASKGIAGFYSGAVPVIAGNALKASTRFYSYETIRNLLRGGDGKLSMAGNVLAGMGAGCMESIVAVTPSEAIKTRLIESRLVTSGSSLQVIGTMIRTESIFSLYRGLIPTMMKQSANSAVRFGSYQAMRDWAAVRSGGDLGNISIMGIGATAGVITVYATMPFDVVKTRMQQASVNYASTLQCFAQSLKQEGPSVFWRGATPRVIRLVLSGTITFVVYENVLRVLQ